jgi:hypothetical protein
MRISMLGRLALAGSRTDTLRVIFTAGSAVLATVVLLAAATLAAVPELGLTDRGLKVSNVIYSSRLISDQGNRASVVYALLMMAIPVLVLAGQCVRFGSPGRDRRLSALRLAGATPRQAVLVAVAETGVAAAFGALIGLGVFLIARVLLHRPDATGRLPLPTDVLPSPLVLLGVLVSVPVLAALAGTVLLRPVIVTPLGVVRRTRDRRPRFWPIVLIIVGASVPYAVRPLLQEIWLDLYIAGHDVRDEVTAAVVLVAVIGVVVGTGWITYATGRVLTRWGRRPAMLLAGRQLLADPWSGSRTFATLLASLVVGAGGLGYAAMLETDFAVEDRVAAFLGVPPPDRVESGLDFRLGTLDLITVTITVTMVVAAAGILIALAEGIVSRRRALAAQIATGVPRRTLAEAVAWQTLTPLASAVVVALAVGLNLTRALATSAVHEESFATFCRGSAEQCADRGSAFWVERQLPAFSQAIPVPVEGLALLGAGALVTMIAVVGVGIVLLRRSTDLEELRVG